MLKIVSFRTILGIMAIWNKGIGVAVTFLDQIIMFFSSVQDIIK